MDDIISKRMIVVPKIMFIIKKVVLILKMPKNRPQKFCLQNLKKIPSENLKTSGQTM